MLQGASFTQPALAALRDALEGWKDGSPWVCVLTSWSLLLLTEGCLCDTEEVRRKAGSRQEGGDREGVPRLITMPCTPSSCSPQASWGWLEHAVSPVQQFPCHRNTPKEDCGAEVGTQPKVKLYSCS